MNPHTARIGRFVPIRDFRFLGEKTGNLKNRQIEDLDTELIIPEGEKRLIFRGQRFLIGAPCRAHAQVVYYNVSMSDASQGNSHLALTPATGEELFESLSRLEWLSCAQAFRGTNRSLPGGEFLELFREASKIAGKSP